ncbi:hypothetical protein Patl1_27499 [Pistacia atlantica]|uniref:Uncharacterized protein n=1 Tax=Pistacia atlantica TaxID=434234 RepID=A0ACC1BCW6_9ROSI|nr:hypothetical protein Patl1_27499 [Pistacia atlantica]
MLLDKDMNPKIAYFGMTRICGADQSQVNTSRIVGTYGYMSPEYILQGQFSVKSNVQFQSLVLEIISSKKSNSFYQSDNGEYLLSYAWRLWVIVRLGRYYLMDQTFSNSFLQNEVARLIHIGLLCVQEDPVDRLMIATVVLMLNNFSVTLSLLKRPGFFVGSTTQQSMPRMSIESIQSSSKNMPSPVNDVSITELHPC